MKKIYIIIVIFLIIGLGTISYFGYKYWQNKPKSNNQSNTNSNSNNTQTTKPPLESKYGLVFPVDQFKKRLYKKPFGKYITSQNSPVQPERFAGFHTGVDIEYEDITTDVPVYAIADGKVVLSRTVSGYGGVFMIEIQLNGATHTVLYGHIRPSSLPKVGLKAKKSDQLAVLGTGYSLETDGERRHLHFAVLSNHRLDLRGYVQTKSELTGWIDPATLYN